MMGCANWMDLLELCHDQIKREIQLFTLHTPAMGRRAPRGEGATLENQSKTVYNLNLLRCLISALSPKTLFYN